MTTQVLIAHTGQRLQVVDTAQFSSLDEFKSWVARQTSIPSHQLVPLTGQGKTVKVARLHQEGEVYVYDLRVTSATPGSAESLVSEVPAPKRYAVPKAPDYIDNSHDIAAWQTLCRERQAWALGLAADAARMEETTRERYSEMDVMIKCLDAAVANLELSIKKIEPQYAELKKYVKPALEEHTQLASNWEQYLDLAKNVPISAAMVNFMTSKDVKKKQATLDDLLQLDTVKKAGSLAATSEKKFARKASDLDKAVDTMYQGLEHLIGEFENLVSRSALSHSEEAGQLLQDIEAVVGKIDTDAQIVQEYGQRELAQASKTAQNQTERLIPSLRKRAEEMDDMLVYATSARNAIAADAVDFMRTINGISNLHGNVKTQCQNLRESDEDMTTFDYLRLIHQLPYMYSSFVGEAIRRREWTEKVKTDSSTLANEMALFQDEESKRRKKWQKSIGSTYGPDSFSNTILGLEVNLLGEEEEWPVMAKPDLEEFLGHLKQQQTESALLEEVQELVNELNAPTKQQSKRVKAFKNGSVHEAALGRSGLMIRGDDDLLRTLQEDKMKLENRLKTAESRVRRLEDLLHRGQATRPGLGSLFGHDRNDSTASIKSTPMSEERRHSSAGTDILQQRIQQLETDVAAERERSTVLEKDLLAQMTQHKDTKGQMEEANITKKDLLGNMEALKREFVEERKSLEDEIKTLKARIEDNEDEMENFGESRENEKATYDGRVSALDQEIERLRKEQKDETLKAQGQVEFLRNEARLQREQNESLEKQLQAALDENKTVLAELDISRESSDSQRKALRSLHEQLAPNDRLPEDMLDLIDATLARSAEVVARLQSSDNDKAVLKSNNEKMHEELTTLRDELAESQKQVATKEESAMHLRESLDEEKAKVSALEKDAAGARSQLDELRAKIAHGETGSESLRQQLDEVEQNARTISEELASKQSQVGSLEEELHMYREKLQVSQGHHSELTGRFDARTDHTKDLTQRIYAQNDRMCRLLERLGFAVTRDESSSAMTFTKVPRAERGSMSQTQVANDSSDPGQPSIRRSSTFQSRNLADSTDLELLYWMNSSEIGAEQNKYDAFMNKLGHFDMDQFAETIYRRVKDVEHLARKLQRDSRAYREKARSLQKDAHEKIAYKHFKEGDLALFLPTRNQSSGAWAAFNVGFPHYFLREQDNHRLRSREWLVARISRIEERVVDLSKSLHRQLPDTDSFNDEDDNPFQLSDGLRWYMIDAVEDKAGAPSTPGLGKSTIATNNVEARADMHTHAQASAKDKQRATGHSIEGVSKALSKSLESRRSSTNSKKALPLGAGAHLLKGNAVASETNSLRTAPAESPPAQEPQAPEAEASGPILARETSGVSEAASKKSVVWDPLWSVGVAFESGGKPT
ncbi:Autophagy-related protein 11 like [Verticillium longisporum]|nr:Autophagy-related protein 11 like [Verticillium longisporum]